MTKLMRSLRTGKIAVYDKELVESGRWEEVRDAPTADEQPKQESKPGHNDSVGVQDEVQVVLLKGGNEGKRRKA